MRNLLLILYFAPFFVAQDTHYLNYLHCRLVNIAQPVSRQCDCGQLLTSPQKDQVPGGEQPATHVHAHLDVYFYHARSLNTDQLHVSYYKISYPLMRVQIFEGMEILPWRPPALQS
ncbi:MAG TPA: hypothetical protein VL943_15435 [Niabella sp.]|nr:hypothetical protein [Niabella sp.]